MDKEDHDFCRRLRVTAQQIISEAEKKAASGQAIIAWLQRSRCKHAMRRLGKCLACGQEAEQ